MLGVCNGAQILLEAGLVPGTGASGVQPRRLRDNGPVPHFVCRHVYMKLAVEPERSPITAALSERRADSGLGRARRRPSRGDAEHLDEIVDGGHLAFVYAHADGTRRCRRRAERLRARLRGAGESATATCSPSCRTPNATAGTSTISTGSEGNDVLAPSGGAALFREFRRGGKRAMSERPLRSR